MHRTPLCLLAALLVALPATAAAQDAARPEPTFVLHVTPDAQHAKPGDVLTFRVRVESRVDQRIELAADASHDGVRHALGATILGLHAGHANGTALTVKVGDGAPERVRVTVKAWSADGESHAASATVGVKRPEPQPTGFRVAAHPAIAHAPPGGTLTYRILVASKVEQAIELRAAHVPEGWRAVLEPPTVKVGPGADAHAKLTLTQADGNATPQKARLLVVASNGEARREVVLHAAFGRDDAKPAQEDWPRLYAALLQRVLRLEAALRAAGIPLEGSPAPEAAASSG